MAAPIHHILLLAAEIQDLALVQRAVQDEGLCGERGGVLGTVVDGQAGESVVADAAVGVAEEGDGEFAAADVVVFFFGEEAAQVGEGGGGGVGEEG